MRIKGRSWVWTNRVNILPAGRGRRRLPYSGLFFLWRIRAPEVLTPRPSPDSTPSQLFPCCTPPQFQDFLPTLPHSWGFPSRGLLFARSPPQPALPGSHCHFSEKRRREAGKQPVFCPHHVPTCPAAPLFSSSSPSPTHPRPYPNGPAPCVPPSSVFVCSPHIPTHPFFDLQRNWLNAHILPSPCPPALRTLSFPAAWTLGDSVFEDTVDNPPVIVRQAPSTAENVPNSPPEHCL